MYLSTYLSDKSFFFLVYHITFSFLGHGGGQVVSLVDFYYDDPSSNPAEVYNFSAKINVEKNENKQKEAGVGPF